MENKIEELTEKRRKVTADNVSLKAKYEVVSRLEKDVYDKLMISADLSNQKLSSFSNEYNAKNRERNEIEAIIRAVEHEIKAETDNNKKLDFQLQNTQKIEEMKQKEYENSLMLRDNLNKSKEDEYLEIDKRIKELNSISTDDPIVKVEYERNQEYKKKIEDNDR